MVDLSQCETKPVRRGLLIEKCAGLVKMLNTLQYLFYTSERWQSYYTYDWTVYVWR